MRIKSAPMALSRTPSTTPSVLLRPAGHSTDEKSMETGDDVYFAKPLLGEFDETRPARGRIAGMRRSMVEYLRLVAHRWWFAVGIVLGCLSLADLSIGDFGVPTWALFVGAASSLTVAQVLAFHDVRVQRDEALAAQRRVIPPEKVFELSDLIAEVQKAWNTSYGDPGFDVLLDEVRSKAYGWIDREAPEFSAAVRSKKGLGDPSDWSDEESFEAFRLVTRLEKIRDQLNARLAAGR